MAELGGDVPQLSADEIRTELDKPEVGMGFGALDDLIAAQEVIIDERDQEHAAIVNDPETDDRRDEKASSALAKLQAAHNIAELLQTLREFAEDGDLDALLSILADGVRYRLEAELRKIETDQA